VAVGGAVGGVVDGAVGAAVGVLVGTFVGALVAVAVGVFVGAVVGELVGVLVGMFVGASVGMPVGASVAASVGVGISVLMISRGTQPEANRLAVNAPIPCRNLRREMTLGAACRSWSFERHALVVFSCLVCPGIIMDVPVADLPQV
jgi:hypothetical protein